MKAGATFAVFEVGSIFARHQERLRHPEQRPQAVRDVAWETSELALGNAARAGAGIGTTMALGVVQGTALAGAAVAGSTAVTVGAPLAAGLAAGWVGSKVVRRTRHQFRLRGGAPYGGRQPE